MFQFFGNLLIPVAVLTLVMLALNIRTFSKLSSPDRFIWRYIGFYSGTEVFFKLWKVLIGSDDDVGYLYNLTEAGTVGLMWFWDRLPGRKWLFVVGLGAFCALEVYFFSSHTARLISSGLVGLVAIYIGFDAVWKGELNWRNILKFGISIILAHSTFIDMVQWMPFCWDEWFSNSFRVYGLYLSLIRLSFCYYYFVGRNVQMN